MKLKNFDRFFLNEYSTKIIDYNGKKIKQYPQEYQKELSDYFGQEFTILMKNLLLKYPDVDNDEFKSREMMFVNKAWSIIHDLLPPEEDLT